MTINATTIQAAYSKGFRDVLNGRYAPGFTHQVLKDAWHRGAEQARKKMERDFWDGL